MGWVIRFVKEAPPAPAPPGAALQQAEDDAIRALDATYFDVVADVYAKGIDRARANADTVQKAAAAVVTLYSGLLAVSFSVTDRPLPVRGVWAGIFLGAAIALSTAYLAFVSRSGSVDRPEAEGVTLSQRVAFRIEQLSGIVEATVHKRAHLLRMSVAALGVGVALIPLPFLDLSEPAGTRPDLPEWTAPPAVTTDAEAEVASILYSAQIAEDIARRRAAGATPTRAKEVAGLTYDVAVVLAGAVVILLAGLPYGRDRSSARGKGTKPPRSRPQDPGLVLSR